MKRITHPLYLLALGVATIAAVLFGLDAFGIQTSACAFLHMKPAVAGGVVLAMAIAPFPTDPVLTAISAAYRNAKYIADLVLPRIPVGKQEFKYFIFDKRETMTIPNTAVGRRSAPNEVSFTATETTGSCAGYGLDDPVPQDDIDNAPEGYDPLGVATEGITELILLDREKRAADLVFAQGTYAAASRTQLSGNHQWSVAHTDANPIPDILTGLDTPVMRPNIMVIGQAAWAGLRTNPQLLKAVNKSTGDTGIAERRAVADMFELEDIIVGPAYYNSAKKGQAASLARLWGKHCALLYVERSAVANKRITFGWTAQWGGRFAGQEPDSKIGLRGGIRVRAGEYVKEVVTANDMGYFIQDCVA